MARSRKSGSGSRTRGSSRTRSRAAGPAPTPAGMLDELAECVVDLLVEQPLFGHLLGHVERVASEDTPTMGIQIAGTGRIALLVNPEFFATRLRSRRARVACLRHELLHLVFGHPFRLDTEHWDIELLGAAADLVVNPHCKHLPDDAITPASYPGVVLSSIETVDAGYAALLLQRARAGRGHVHLDVWHSDHRFWHPRAGMSGGDEGLAARAAGAWFDGLVSDAYQRLGARALYGLTPNLGLLVAAALERHRATVDWRRVLRLFAASSMRTHIVSTLKQRSRRYGTLPGNRIKRHQRLALAIDTSGSVAERDLSTFFSEIHGIWRHGADITVIECDAAVQRTYPYVGRLPSFVSGRGGTRFDPVLEWLRERRDRRFDACIYLTDGHAAAPTVPPPCPLLWVVTREGKSDDHLRFGRRIRLAG